jgi:hypothetical protein
MTATCGRLSSPPMAIELRRRRSMGWSRYGTPATGKVTATMAGNAGPVISATFLRHGDKILTTANDGSTRLWDVARGQPLRTFGGHEDLIWATALSPMSFSRHGRQQRRCETVGCRNRAGHPHQCGHGGDAMSAAFSPRADWFLTTEADRVFLWRTPLILFEKAEQQVVAACRRLREVNAPLAFSRAQIQDLPILEGEPADPDNPDMLLSPCKGVLPEEAFADVGE